MDADRMVLAVARQSHAAVTTGQLHAAGLSDDAIRYRVAKGWLRRRHRGVYLVGPLETPLSRAMAAVLAYGEGALLSHRSAAVLWGLCPPPAGALHVTVVGRDARDRDGVGAHTARRLHPTDATRHEGIPVTSPARTLLDLATQAGDRDLARATEEAQIRHLLKPSLDEQFARYPNHPGVGHLKAATRPDPAFTRSEAERRFLELISAARLPSPRANVRLGGREVDFLWADQRLVVEVDGFAFHSTRGAFERDRRRDAELAARGYRVIRVTWRQLAEEPEAVVATLATALAAQPAPSRRVRSSAVSA